MKRLIHRMNQTAHISLQILAISKSVETKLTGCANSYLARPAGILSGLSHPRPANLRVSASVRPVWCPPPHLCAAGRGVLRLVAQRRKHILEENASSCPLDDFRMKTGGWRNFVYASGRFLKDFDQPVQVTGANPSVVCLMTVVPP